MTRPSVTRRLHVADLTLYAIVSLADDGRPVRLGHTRGLDVGAPRIPGADPLRGMRVARAAALGCPYLRAVRR